MLLSLEVTLTFWRPDGSDGDRKMLKQQIKHAFPGYSVLGDAVEHSDVWITICSQTLALHRRNEEPHESLFVAVTKALSDFASVANNTPLSVISDIRRQGYSISAAVIAGIDDDQIEIGLPFSILAALGRLNIDLRINSDNGR